MKKILQEKKGITLIALIITIIVLLILAVTAISAVQESDIIMHAKRAVSETEMAQIREQAELIKSEMFLESKMNPNLQISKKTYLSKLEEKFDGRYSRVGDILIIDEIYAVSVLNSNFDLEVKEYTGVINADKLLSLSYTSSEVIMEDEIQEVTIKLNLKSIMSSTDYETLKKSQEKELKFADMEQAVFDVWTEATSSFEGAKEVESIDDVTVMLLNNSEDYDIFVDSDGNRINHVDMKGWIEDTEVLNIVKSKYPTITELTPDLVNQLVHGYENYEEYIIDIYNNEIKEETDYISEYNDNTTNLSLYVNDETTPRVTNIGATVEGVDLGDYTLTNNGTIEFTIKNSEDEIVLQFEKITINNIASNKNEYYVLKEDSEWETNGEGTVTRYKGKEKVVTIPLYVGSEEIIAIDGFSNSMATNDVNPYTEKVIIPNSIEKIGQYAFYKWTALKEVSISNTVTSIGYNSFTDCTSLTSIDIPDSVTTISMLAFDGCTGLTSIDIPDSVTSIGEEAFKGCIGLTSIDIPDSITKIERRLFYGCKNLTSIDIPDSVTTIEYSAFKGCTSLTSIDDIIDSVTSIGEEAFYGCNGLISIDIPNSVTSIARGAFRYCTNLRDVDLSKSSITRIEEYTFAGCESLYTITIPDSVKYMGMHTFDNCTSLKYIYFKPGDDILESGKSTAWGAPKGLKTESNPEGVVVDKAPLQ